MVVCSFGAGLVVASCLGLRVVFLYTFLVSLDGSCVVCRGDGLRMFIF